MMQLIAILSFVLMCMTAYLVYLYKQQNESFAQCVKNKQEGKSCSFTPSCDPCMQGLSCTNGVCKKPNLTGISSKVFQAKIVPQSIVKECQMSCVNDENCAANKQCKKCRQSKCSQ
jgi:hypothetical protein